jgi:hypothetical protein
MKSLKISFIASWYSIVITNLHCNHQENLPSELGARGNNISKSSSKEQFGLHPQVVI